MKNLLFIQSEKLGKDDYLFVDNKLILNKNEIINIVSGGKLFEGRFDFPLKRNKSPLAEIAKKNPFGFLITGELNDLDLGNRKMSFTCLYSGDVEKLEQYFEECLNQIGKSINSESFKIIKKTISNFNTLKNITITLLLLSISIYLTFKLI